MSTVVVELYEALKQAGVDETLARDAASAVVPANALADLATNHQLLATKHELKQEISMLRLEMKQEISELRLATKADMSEMKTELIKWNLGAMAILTAIFAAIAGLT